MSYTKGPWKVFKSKGGAVKLWAGGVHVATVAGPKTIMGPPTRYIQEDNAFVLAAAPDLLEALKAVLAISDRKHEAWDKARNAIAKAEGCPF